MTRYHRILLLSLAFFVLMVTVAIFHEDGILTVFKVEDEMSQMRKNNDELKRENDRLRAEIEGLKTNSAAIEKIAREKFNWVKPGETVYQIVRQPNQPSKTF